MNRAFKVILYTSVVVAGWQALRYFYGRLLTSADLDAEQSSVRDKRAYRRATERWENEGGATLAGHRSGPPTRRRAPSPTPRSKPAGRSRT